MARKPKVIQPPRHRRLSFKRTSPVNKPAYRPRPRWLRRYAFAMQVHPVRTVAIGVLSLSAVVAAAGGAYYYFVAGKQVPTWSGVSAAAGAVPPYAAFEDTPFNIYGDAAIQTVQDGDKRVIRFVGPANRYAERDGARSQRAELVPKLASFKPGQEVWVGLDIKLNADLGVATDFQNILQLKNDTEGSPSLAITANTNQAGLDIRRTTGPDDGDTYSQPLGELPTAGYSRLIIGMKLTTSPTSSWVEVWRDGQPKLLRTNWDAYNQAGDGQAGGLLYANAQSAYLKVGLYRGPQAWPMDVRLADLKIGPNRDSVK